MRLLLYPKVLFFLLFFLLLLCCLLLLFLVAEAAKFELNMGVMSLFGLLLRLKHKFLSLLLLFN